MRASDDYAHDKVGDWFIFFHRNTTCADGDDITDDYHVKCLEWRKFFVESAAELGTHTDHDIKIGMVDLDRNFHLAERWDIADKAHPRKRSAPYVVFVRNAYCYEMNRVMG